MLFYDYENISQNIHDISNIKWNLKLSIQRFLQLYDDFRIISNLEGDEEKESIYNEIKNESDKIIACIGKVVNQAKSNCVKTKNNVEEEDSCNDSDELCLEDDELLCDTGEIFSDADSTFMNIINDKGLYNSSEDEDEEENGSLNNLSISSEETLIDDDNLIPCTSSGAPDFSASLNNSTKKRRRISSSSSLETIIPPRKHYKLYESEEDIDDDLEDTEKDDDEPDENNDKPEEHDDKPEDDEDKVEKISSNIETIVLSSDGEMECDDSSAKKYQRKIYNDGQLTQTTRQAKKLNDIYRKEYSHRRENKEIIRYCSGHNDRPYYERQIKSITLEDDEYGKVCVDEAFVNVLKPHQAEGIDFLFFTTIRSLKYLDDPGNGGILAHCMGLGKSLQVIVYLQTIFFNPKISEKISKGLLLVPTNVINNWQRECEYWQSLIKDKNKKFGVYALISDKSSSDSHKNYLSTIEGWINSSRPSIIIVGYEMFRNLVTLDKNKRSRMTSKKQNYLCSKYCEYLQGRPDIVICDEAHKLKNINSQLAIVVNDISTRRRICLTGTPIQNNLREYFTMINFVRPNLLGTYKEFSNQFVNPIEKGIKQSATPSDVRLMKKRYAVLWRLLDHVLHRKDASFLYSTLPPKEEYIIYCATATVQIKLLKELIEKFSSKTNCLQYRSVMSYICTHPSILNRISSSTYKNKKSYDIDESSESEDIDNKPEFSKWLTTNNLLKDVYWNNFELSSKMIILFEILKYAEKVGDKVLVFVQYRETINYIEKSLQYFAENNLWYSDNHTHCQKSIKRTWKLYKDYFIITGETSLDERSFIQSRINLREKKSTRPRLVLMTTRASSLGTNFIGANRVVLFEPGFNPSDDIQALHRVYRIGQTKPSFVYRLVAQGTIEERIQERQIIKEGISRCSIDKHNIRDLYDDEETRFDKLNCIDVSDPSYCRETLLKPNDDLLSNLIIKNPKRIINYAVYDSLLENKVDEGLTEEEKEKEWDNYIEEQKRIEDGEFQRTYANVLLNNVAPVNSMPFVERIIDMVVPRFNQNQ